MWVIRRNPPQRQTVMSLMSGIDSPTSAGADGEFSVFYRLARTTTSQPFLSVAVLFVCEPSE